MTLPDDLLDEIDALLAHTSTINLTNASDACDLYEAYVFSLAIEAASNEHGAVSYHNRNGTPLAGPFVFRTSPGNIYSTHHNYCYARISFVGKPTLELHLGVFVVGVSKVKHECDVAILWHNEAETCRQNTVHPHSKKLVASAECKLYQNSDLSLGLGRGFLGLTMDLKGSSGIFVSDNSSDSIEKLLTYHNRLWEHEVVPGNDVEVTRLRGKLEEAFKNFKTKN